MKNQETLISALNELKKDNTEKQKRGLHFIMASVIIWAAILIIHLSPLKIGMKNLLTFCCSVPLVPLALLFSKILKVDFQNKGNPLSGLGLLFALDQMLYILIAMWAYAESPENMLMIYAMIFGAHLLPYGWIYSSKPYYVLAVAIPIISLIIGVYFSTVWIAAFMLITEIIFSVCLMISNKKKA